MIGLLKGLRLFALVIWVGGIAFFAFVVAPVAFGSLPTAHEAGMVVRGAILALHWIGLVVGPIAVVAALMLRRILQAGLLLGMIVVTAASQFGVLPRMELDRARAGGAVDELPAGDANRVEFDRMHVLSERMEGLVLLLGIGVLGLVAREREDTPLPPPKSESTFE